GNRVGSAVGNSLVGCKQVGQHIDAQLGSGAYSCESRVRDHCGTGSVPIEVVNSAGEIVRVAGGEFGKGMGGSFERPGAGILTLTNAGAGILTLTNAGAGILTMTNPGAGILTMTNECAAEVRQNCRILSEFCCTFCVLARGRGVAR
ncbi:hypothetical protein, partial [Corynebacterium sp. HMSC28B08]|uniref:hypothetical protein n=1 Tax=Corynebacterium sp. HMSC28B08 TaxID=1581066 RepID=UPI001AEF80C9